MMYTSLSSSKILEEIKLSIQEKVKNIIKFKYKFKATDIEVVKP